MGFGIRAEPLSLLKNRILKRSFDIVFSLTVVVLLLDYWNKNRNAGMLEKSLNFYPFLDEPVNFFSMDYTEN